MLLRSSLARPKLSAAPWPRILTPAVGDNFAALATLAKTFFLAVANRRGNDERALLKRAASVRKRRLLNRAGFVGGSEP